MIKKRHLLIPLLLVFGTVRAGQLFESREHFTTDKGWYTGLRSGAAFGISTFSSFGADKTRAGWSAGLYGGYRFNPVLSLEASAVWGKLNMGIRDCCPNYWLDIDANHYFTPAQGLIGWDYDAIFSRVNTQQYGVNLHINLLGFFPATRPSRWALSLAPAIYAARTEATICMLNGDPVLKKQCNWHLGFGGNLVAKYRITDKLSAGLYSGLTCFTGRRIDGMPEYLHTNNYTWESGIRLEWSFGKRKRTTQTKQSAPVTPARPVEQPKEPPVSVLPEQTPSTEMQTVAQSASVVPDQPVEAAVSVAEAGPAVEFPVIYFSFNSVWIEPEQRSKVKIIAQLLKADPQMKIVITGYADSVGGEAVNLRVSKQRAEAVKRVLGAWLIDRNRITTRAGGVNRAASTRSEARHAATIEIQ